MGMVLSPLGSRSRGMTSLSKSTMSDALYLYEAKPHSYPTRRLKFLCRATDADTPAPLMPMLALTP